jgi:hypothetical protein
MYASWQSRMARSPIRFAVRIVISTKLRKALPREWLKVLITRWLKAVLGQCLRDATGLVDVFQAPALQRQSDPPRRGL